jgi:lipoprotein-anchoring transpeptidase ErfK/SrfK
VTNIAQFWLLPTTVIAVALATAPVQSSAAEQPVAPTPATVVVEPAPASAPPPATLVADPAALDPGEFVWQPERAAAGPVEIVVSLPLQIAYVFRGGTLFGVTTVSTGRPGHATPTGRFAIMEKHREHYSNRYNNAPMPFMQRLTMDGIALHAGQIPGRPASHGCVRLPLAFARNLFAVTQIGANVHIVDAAPTAEAALAVARGRVVLASN